MLTWFREDELLGQLLEAHTGLFPCAEADSARRPLWTGAEPEPRGGSLSATGGPTAAPARQARSPRVGYKAGAGVCLRFSSTFRARQSLTLHQSL